MGVSDSHHHPPSISLKIPKERSFSRASHTARGEIAKRSKGPARDCSVCSRDAVVIKQGKCTCLDAATRGRDRLSIRASRCRVRGSGQGASGRGSGNVTKQEAGERQGQGRQAWTPYQSKRAWEPDTSVSAPRGPRQPRIDILMDWTCAAVWCLDPAPKDEVPPRTTMGARSEKLVGDPCAWSSTNVQY